MNFGNHKRALFLFSVTKVSKNTLSTIGPKVEKSPPKSVGIDFHSTISAHLFRKLQSVLIGDFSVSALFSKGSVLPHLFLKDSSY